MTLASNFTTFSQTSTGKRPWTHPSNAATSNNSRATASVDEGADPATWEFETESLIATRLANPPPFRAKDLTAIRVRVERRAAFLAPSPYTDAVADLHAHLCIAGAPVGPDKKQLGAWGDGDAVATYEWEAATLQTAGITLATLRNPTFGFMLSATKPGQADPIQPEIDHIQIEYDFDHLSPLPSGEEHPMDHYIAGRQGGFSALLAEPIPDISASTAIFANAPTGTAMIEISPVGEDLVIRWGAGEDDASIDPEGNIYPAGATYRFPVNQTHALLAKAIENAATCVGWITYWGIA